jgi:Beta-ketoacyl synthase, N-terminal domain
MRGAMVGHSSMSPLTFSVARWAAWAPGVTAREAWLEWAHKPFAPLGAEVPPLDDVPPMTRRRIERLGRLAYHVAASCEGEAREIPAIFACRHGDAARSLELLSAMAKGEALSPTSFGLSVHNAVAGQYSIARKDPANFISLSAGRWSAESAFIEALGLLADGHPQVLVVLHEAALSAIYADYRDEPDADFAWAVLLEQGPTFSLRTTETAVPEAPSPLPHALEVLRFLLLPDLAALAAGRWIWRRG